MIENVFCRKDFQNMLNTKKELKNLVVKQNGFIKDNPIFVNQRLCKHYCVLWSVTKRFYSLKRISIFYVSGGIFMLHF